MPRRPARVTQADIARAVRAAGPSRVVEVLPDGAIRILAESEKSEVAEKGRARNASGYVEARLADAPWARSK
jgi:hypothetical protein